MVPEYSYVNEANLYLVPTEELNSRGKPVCRMIVVRRMFLALDDDLEPCGSVAPRYIKVVRIVRYDENDNPIARYSVSHSKEETSDWPTQKMRPDQESVKFKRYEMMAEEPFLRYLTFMLGARSIEALHELITMKATRKSKVDEE